MSDQHIVGQFAEAHKSDEDRVAREKAVPPHRDPRSQLSFLAQQAFNAGGLPALRAHLRECAAWHARSQKPQRLIQIAFNRRDQEVAWNLTRGRCFYCGVQLFAPNVCAGGIVSWGALWIEVDHYTSRKLGGSSRASNLRPACRWCNQLKRGHSVEVFRKMFAREHGSPFFFGEIAS